MADRFELENDILSLTSVADDLDVLAQAIMEHDPSEDDILNVIMGLSGVLRMKVDKTFDTFKAAFNLDEYNQKSQSQYGDCGP